MEDMLCGGGHYECEKCGETVFGSAIHYCEVSKEKPMENKVIFESEEEFEIAFKFFIDASFNDSYSIILNDAKRKNLIRKSPVEEAEEMWMYWKPYEKDRAEDNRFIEIQHEAIQYLKARQK